MHAGRAAALSVSLLALALWGCPQDIRGADDDDGTGASDGGGTSGDGGGTSGDGGGTSGDGGARDGGSRDGGGANNGLAVSCERQGTGPVAAGVSVELRCTSTPAASSWSFSADPAYATFGDQLATRGRLYVTFKASSLPAWFADTTAVVTVGASAAAASGSAVVEVPVLGNVLAAVGGSTGGIASYRSDGSRGADFAGPASIAGATMLLRTQDGKVLAGAVAGTATPALQLFDSRGVLERVFQTTDTADNALFPAGSHPWGATQEADGTLWVSMHRDNYSDGAVYRYSPQGTWLQTLPRPSGLGASDDWVPLGMGVLSDGTVAVASGDSLYSAPYLGLYRKDGSTQHLGLGFERCDPGPVCHFSSGDTGGRAQGILVHGGEVFITLEYSSGATIAAYSDPGLGFLRSTQRAVGSYGYTNYTFGSLTRVGPLLVAGRPTGGCALAVDPQTLYAPAGWPGDPACWAPSGPTLKGLAHLGP